MSNPDIIIHTDGSSRGNPGPGGYGIVMQKFDSNYIKEFSEGYRKTTNNRMELLAAIMALKKVKTNSEITDFLMNYGDKFLGKDMVLCKDTPAFIANRIGVANIMSLFHLVKELDLTVEEVDSLSGPIIGRPKSATFRTCDLVGLDTLMHVANGVYENCSNDEMRAKFELPDFITKMSENKLI